MMKVLYFTNNNCATLIGPDGCTIDDSFITDDIVDITCNHCDEYGRYHGDELPPSVVRAIEAVVNAKYKGESVIIELEDRG